MEAMNMADYDEAMTVAEWYEAMGAEWEKFRAEVGDEFEVLTPDEALEHLDNLL
jgi:hypothetical protein